MNTAPLSHQDTTAGLGQEPLSAPGQLPEATLFCCALAAFGSPLSGADAQYDYVERVRLRAMADHTDAELARWRSFDGIPPSSWDYRWAWARRAVQRFYPHATGVDTIPESHDDAGLPGSYTPSA